MEELTWSVILVEARIHSFTISWWINRDSLIGSFDGEP